jgi:hypothetical protein
MVSTMRDTVALSTASSAANRIRQYSGDHGLIRVGSERVAQMDAHVGNKAYRILGLVRACRSSSCNFSSNERDIVLCRGLV